MAQPPRWIAIVDDDPSVLKALSRLLRTRAIDTRTYESARDFLNALPEEPTGTWPECLILDLQMPEMNGLELQRHLNRSGIQIPTIVITAHSEDDMRELCMTAGADAYLLKPLEDLSLIAAINDIRSRGARS
ncbi:FixJ family two-component response regulator [Bradyrhizobium japonicum]|uniref:response regulator n=1 Tax=Bradyrhizobium TaxID=374 RepID=UPI0004808FC5|nr:MULTISPECIES: response regulator [Bradyrhizobium]MBR0881979.1 response regulator [Bradyrhizobium liaoningense]MBR1000432.1 response regulator [Bradyrhizobium liaoningense]MBR1066946.1 response regulator [Bradyrhizobium liaoningense]MCP1743795.1 FixJ family two-component response regulator [Bradyrhizobium japonicum]MCP1782084.1 FixJ family two-component response regulator [Bradyrhizobium japonicum]